jgi:hypothetical protein
MSGPAGPADHLSRPYRHTKCGGVTVVSGDHYVLLECPFRPVNGTFCARCQAFVPLHTVVWEDSGENIAEYRDRLYKSVPFKRRLYLNWLGTAYEGALNLRLDKRGKPLPPEEGPARP